MQVGVACRHPAAGRAHHESLLYQVGLDDILDRAPLLAQCSSQGLDADRTAIELLDDGLKQASIHRIKAIGIDVQHIHCTHCDRLCHHAVRFDLGEIAHPAQQAIDDSRRTTSTVGDLPATFHFQRQFQDPGSARSDLFQLPC